MNRHPRLFALLVAGCVALALLAGGLLYYVISRNDSARQALCAQRADLDQRLVIDARRLARSRQYLRDHPHGAPGIPRSLVVQSIADDAQSLTNARKFRANLDILNC